MSLDSHIFIGFLHGGSRHTQNLTSTSLLIYSHYTQLVSSGGACLVSATKNIVEYSVGNELLSNINSLGTPHLLIHLDSQLIVSQLNDIYHVHDSSLLWKYLWVKLIERNFKYITYIHIHRSLNQVIDVLENHILNWHINNEVTNQNHTQRIYNKYYKKQNHMYI